MNIPKQSWEAHKVKFAKYYNFITLFARSLPFDWKISAYTAKLPIPCVVTTWWLDTDSVVTVVNSPQHSDYILKPNVPANFALWSIASLYYHQYTLLYCTLASHMNLLIFFVIYDLKTIKSVLRKLFKSFYICHHFPVIMYVLFFATVYFDYSQNITYNYKNVMHKQWMCLFIL